jgi:hypothetical protein
MAEGISQPSSRIHWLMLVLQRSGCLVRTYAQSDEQGLQLGHEIP